MSNESSTEVSVADDSLDQMVEAASVRNLADLFRQAKDEGLIQATTAYGGPPSAGPPGA